jgi:hypothetical protein
LTYGVEILRIITIGSSRDSMLYSINLLALFGIFMLIFAIRGFVKTE